MGSRDWSSSLPWANGKERSEDTHLIHTLAKQLAPMKASRTWEGFVPVMASTREFVNVGFGEGRRNGEAAYEEWWMKRWSKRYIWTGCEGEEQRGRKNELGSLGIGQFLPFRIAYDAQNDQQKRDEYALTKLTSTPVPSLITPNSDDYP